MNERFKFRVWVKKSRKMLNVGLIDFRYGKVWFQELISDASPYGILREQDFEIMQCTGLKDKNGKLVFEGDILQTDADKIISVVRFGTISHKVASKFEGFGLVDVDITGFYYEISGEKVFMRSELKISDDCTIIGNIHQNSELLEKGGK